jgi:hypothetical protein
MFYKKFPNLKKKLAKTSPLSMKGQVP